MPITALPQGWAAQPSGTRAAAITGDTRTHIGLGFTAAQRPGRERGWQPLTDDELAVQALISQRQGRIISTVLLAQSKYLLSCFAHP